MVFRVEARGYSQKGVKSICGYGGASGSVGMWQHSFPFAETCSIRFDMNAFAKLENDIAACQLCADRFATTKTVHQPRPIFWPSQTARILISGQAPGMRVHESGIPFDDRSGDRLRDWLGVTRAQFYDRDLFAILPMGFCFPGYDDKGSDLPPPPLCAKTWRKQALEMMPQISLSILVGGYAQRWHLGKGSVTETVKNWRMHLPDHLVLPHPSWRNSGWLKKNPWFEVETLGWLRTHVAHLLENG